MNVRRDRVELPTGDLLDAFHVVELPDWAATICITDDHRLIMVEQYRHGLQTMSLEFPAGAIDNNETPLEAAQRELLEETGFVATTWHTLSQFSPEPSKHTNTGHFFIAKHATHVQAQQLELTEDLRLHFLTVEEAFEALEAGRIVHGLHATALLHAWYKQHLTN